MILILGGTSEARALAAALTDRGDEILSTLAGRVARPRLPSGPVRVGGFGGTEGLARFLIDHRVRCVIDATHPFAPRISANAVRATRSVGIPLARLERPGWSAATGSDEWSWVDSHAQAALLAAQFSRPLLTIGRQALGEFVTPLHDHPVLARVVDTPDIAVPPTWQLIHDRGPYDLDGERSLLSGSGIDVLVTKDSGGSYTWPKIEAAVSLGIDVVIVRRPVTPAAGSVVTTVVDAVSWLDSHH